MYEQLREDEIINKVGGRFRLSSLIQKRMAQLIAGARPLVDLNTEDKMRIVIEEIMQDKIYLDMEGKVQVAPGAQPSAPPLDFHTL